MSIKSKIEELRDEIEQETGYSPRIDIHFDRVENEGESRKIVTDIAEDYGSTVRPYRSENYQWYSTEAGSLGIAAFYKEEKAGRKRVVYERS